MSVSLQFPAESIAAAASVIQLECASIDDDPDSACLHVAGELDIATAPQLDLALHEAVDRAQLVVLDLRDLDFIDVAGVRVVVSARARARLAGRRVVVLRGSPTVDRVFGLSECLATATATTP